MGSLLGILFELLLLAAFGFLYYLFQKRRIIRIDKIEIFEIISDLAEEYKTNEFVQKLQVANNEQNYHSIETLLLNAPNDFKQKENEVIELLIDKVKFHTKSK